MTESSLSRITSILESARDFTIETAVSASARLSETPTQLRPAEIIKLLSSRADRDKLNGMKCVVSLISRGEDGTPYFADVVKNITSTDPQIRKLVCNYITRYAELEPDTALLSINAIQRTLSDQNASSRAFALRVMSGIRISAISPILLLGIKTCISDLSAVVRSAAAIAISKCYDVDNANQVQLLEYLKQLLSDKDVQVLSSAIKSFYKLFPTRYDLIHGHFRYYCKILSELDEWCQVYLIGLLTNYCRLFLPRPKLINRATNEVIALPEDYSTIFWPVYDVEIDSDLQLFLDSIKFLIYSRNEAVVLSTGKAFFYLTPPKTFKEYQINAAFARLITSSQAEVSFFVLQSILIMSLHDPTLFVQYYKRFYIFPRDSVKLAKFKLETLSLICNENNVKQIFEELQYYTLHSEKQIASEAVKSIGRIAQISSVWSHKVLKWSLRQINANDSKMTSDLLTIVRFLIQQSPDKDTNLKTIYRLSKVLIDNPEIEPEAKASIIWLVGEDSNSAKVVGPDFLRKLLPNFANEEEEVRYQILLLAAKVYSYDLDRYKEIAGDSLDGYDFTQAIPKMFQFVLHLAKYDFSYDTRDRARMLSFLLSNEQSKLATLFLQVPKTAPIISLNSSINSDHHSKDELSVDEKLAILQVNRLLIDFNSIQEWSSEDKLPSAAIREELPLKEYDTTVKSIQSSSRARSSSPVISSTGGISSAQFHQQALRQQAIPKPKQSYKLQSLDEFFADDGDSTTSILSRLGPQATGKLEEFETSSDELEDDSEEEEDSDEEEEDDNEESDAHVEEEGEDESSEYEDDSDDANEATKMMQ